ncbi:MAG: histidinol-phosphatase [Alphaproteobacteria bacterium]|nr:histidinol-phosphatase [Alphaproteobacteria bacterium]
MTMIDQNTIAFANRLADAAGKVIRPMFRKVEAVDKAAEKGGLLFDPVTEADRQAESAIRTLIRREHPDDGILGEEHGEEAGTSGRVWVIDPIDGTRAFITGRHTWGTLIALRVEGRSVLGILDQPVLRERFIGYGDTAKIHSIDGSQALRTRACTTLSDAVVSTTHPWSYFDAGQRKAFEQICEAARMSYFGGDCYAYGLLAMGLIDVIVEGRLNPWDIAALIPIIENAGGLVTDWRGRKLADGGSVIAAGDARVHAQAIAILAGAEA